LECAYQNHPQNDKKEKVLTQSCAFSVSTTYDEKAKKPKKAENKG